MISSLGSLPRCGCGRRACQLPRARLTRLSFPIFASTPSFLVLNTGFAIGLYYNIGSPWPSRVFLSVALAVQIFPSRSDLAIVPLALVAVKTIQHRLVSMVC